MQLKQLLTASLALNLAGIIAAVILISSLGGPRYLLFRLNNHGGDAMSTGRTEMFAQLPADSGKIMFLGDSLIQNGEWSELLQNGNILNRGVIGQWSGVLRQRLPQILASQPGSIFLMTGINDLKALTPEEVANTLKGIVEDISRLSPSSKLFLQSILPVNNTLKNTGRINRDIIQLNQLVKGICEQRPCSFVDVHPDFINEHGQLDARYSHDGVHLNGQGYLKWAGLLAPLIEEQTVSSTSTSNAAATTSPAS